MAGLRKLRNKWYARVLHWDGYRQHEEIIALNTELKTEALERLSIVNKYEKDIKSGISFTFPWSNKRNQISVKRFTISEAVVDYLGKRILNGVRSKTIDIYKLALNHFINVVGKNIPLESVKTDHVDSFISFYQEKHSVTTINMNLRALKTFFMWHHKRGNIEKIPMIQQLLCEEEEPQYITDEQFENILALEWLPQRYKNAFIFYRETGCRLFEPFFSKLNGNWMEIPKEHSKNRKAKHIQLNDRLISIRKDMVDHYYEHPTDDRVKYYSKQFQKALRALGIKNRKLHSLRHTFCIRKILATNGNIFKVSDDMGHKNVSTTQRYAKIDKKLLNQDFPTLSESFNNP